MAVIKRILAFLHWHLRQNTVPKAVRKYRTVLFQTYVIAVSLVLGFASVLAHFLPYFPFDLIITKSIQHYNAPWFDYLMKLISSIGQMPQIIILIALFVFALYFVGLKWEAVVTVISAALSVGLNVTLKVLVDRKRPSIDLVNVYQHLKDNSFPSGHVMLYTTLFGYLLFLAFILVKNSWYRLIYILVFMFLILAVGPSRIYEGAHWASDVFAAYLFGSLVLSLCIYIYRWGKTKFFVTQPVAPEKGV